MSILILGKTKCPLCGDAIERQDDSIQLPPFLWSEDDALSVFNDASLHQTCFDQAPRHQEVLTLVRELGQRTGPGSRKCVVCGEEITDPDDYLMLPPMTNDPANPLYAWRYTHLHKSHAASWDEFESVVESIRELTAKQQGQPFRHLLNELEEAWPSLT